MIFASLRISIIEIHQEPCTEEVDEAAKKSVFVLLPELFLVVFHLDEPGQVVGKVLAGVIQVLFQET